MSPKLPCTELLSRLVNCVTRDVLQATCLPSVTTRKTCKCRCRSIPSVLPTVLLAFTFLLSCTVQGLIDRTGGLATLEAQGQERQLLASHQEEQTQNIAHRVRSYRRKPTPKHKRSAKRDRLTETRGKNGSLNRWTRTQSVSRLGPKRIRPPISSQDSTRWSKVQRNRRSERSKLRLVRLRKQKQAKKSAAAVQRRKNRRSPKQASPQQKMAKRKRTVQPAVPRRKAPTPKSDPRHGPASKLTASRPSTTKKQNAARRNAAKKMRQKRAKKGFHWRGKGKHGFKWNDERKRPHRIPWKGKVVYDEGDVICVAQSEQERNITESQSAKIHASAVASAFSYLCDPGPNLDLVLLEEWFEEAEAHALAEAAIKARLTCKSRNRKTPNTCVSYSASATAIAEATVEAHADAVTSAVKACPCMNVDAASAFASASLFVELVADAAVTAEATVCVEGREIETQVVWEKCTSKLYAKLFARAAAEASTHGTCLSAEAKAAVKAYVGAEITVHNTPQCDVKPEQRDDSHSSRCSLSEWLEEFGD